MNPELEHARLQRALERLASCEGRFESCVAACRARPTAANLETLRQRKRELDDVRDAIARIRGSTVSCASHRADRAC